MDDVQGESEGEVLSLKNRNMESMVYRWNHVSL